MGHPMHFFWRANNQMTACATAIHYILLLVFWPATFAQGVSELVSVCQVWSQHKWAYDLLAVGLQRT